jgi:RNA polymerase sigma-70 factor (sigma-E family)
MTSERGTPATPPPRDRLRVQARDQSRFQARDRPRGDGAEPDPDADPDAQFVAFAAASTPSLARTAWLLTGSAADADDLVQEALVRTYTAWHRIRHDDAQAYARRAMANRHIDRWRRSRRELAAWVRGGPHREFEDGASHRASDDRDELVRALQLLRPRERTILVLRYYADLSEQRVAHELGVSVGTVKSTASRALTRLRSLLAERDMPHPAMPPAMHPAIHPAGHRTTPDDGAAIAGVAVDARSTA